MTLLRERFTHPFVLGNYIHAGGMKSRFVIRVFPLLMSVNQDQSIFCNTPSLNLLFALIPAYLDIYSQ